MGTVRTFSLALALPLAGCTVAADPSSAEDPSASAEDVKTSPGVNGGACALSPYNCKLRDSGGNRIAHTDGSVDWAVDEHVTVLDGNGDPLGTHDLPTLKLNYGQLRVFGGQRYVYAMSTTAGTSGWFPLAHVTSHTSLAARIGNVHAHRGGLTSMSCYAVADAIDDALASKKVVHDSKEKPGPAGEAAGDYLPRVRANGARSVNLVFNVPGSALGGPAIDHFPAGTKFQRLDVPTDSGKPSIDVPLWTQDANGDFKTPAGSLKFVYGYVVAKTGDVRVGWMAYPALVKSSGCP